jgi:hypothetical protein
MVIIGKPVMDKYDNLNYLFDITFEKLFNLSNTTMEPIYFMCHVDKDEEAGINEHNICLKLGIAYKYIDNPDGAYYRVDLDGIGYLGRYAVVDNGDYGNSNTKIEIHQFTL